MNLASAFDAIIIGFNIRPDNNAKEAAEREGVDIRLYRVIYQAIEDIEKAMKGLLAPEYKEVVPGPGRGAQHLPHHRRGHRGRLLCAGRQDAAQRAGTSAPRQHCGLRRQADTA